MNSVRGSLKSASMSSSSLGFMWERIAENERLEVHLIDRLNRNRRAAEGGGAAEAVDEEVVGEVVDASCGMLTVPGMISSEISIGISIVPARDRTRTL